MNTIPPLVLHRKQYPQDLSENGSEEQQPCANGHSLGIERTLLFREESRPGNRAGLPNHTKYDQSCSSLRGRTLVISHPCEGESHGREHAAANKVGGKISHGTSFDKGLDQVSNSAYCAQCTEEVGAIFDFVR